jgi:hypothetical protein
VTLGIFPKQIIEQIPGNNRFKGHLTSSPNRVIIWLLLRYMQIILAANMSIEVLKWLLGSYIPRGHSLTNPNIVIKQLRLLEQVIQDRQVINSHIGILKQEGEGHAYTAVPSLNARNMPEGLESRDKLLLLPAERHISIIFILPNETAS